MQPKHDHARRGRRGKGHEFAEIEVEGQKNAFFRRSLRKNLGVRQALQALLAQMNGIVPRSRSQLTTRPATPASARNRISPPYAGLTCS
jgi:hypothetical protein